MKQNLVLLLALLTSALFFEIDRRSQQPPEIVSADAPESQFSAERAAKKLQGLIAENVPHPTGSVANQIIRDRLLAELDSLNIEASLQKTWACNPKWHRCAEVENVIGFMPGDTSKKAVMLMAHYDSVPTSPGAGDDMAAVAAILETARILKQNPPTHRPIVLLFTDAEEKGLIGAYGFFDQHPMAEDIELVLNYEGSGTKGFSRLLRTSDANQPMLDLLAESEHAMGHAFTNEIFKRMPNDTDFSVVLDAGISGMDFAFAGERNHYHTYLDNFEQLDMRTLQHHGENMLPLVQNLANLPEIQELADRDTYTMVYGYLLSWPEEYSAPLLIFALVMLLLAYRQQNAGLVDCIKALGLIIFTMILIIGLSQFMFWLTDTLNGTRVAWPSEDLPYRIMLFSTALFCALSVAKLSSGFVDRDVFLTTSWLFWWLLTVLALWFSADLATFLLPAVLVAGLLLTISMFTDQFRPYWQLLTIPLGISGSLSAVLGLEESQGYQLIMATYPFLILFAIVVMPFFQEQTAKLILPVTVMVMFGCVVMIYTQPLYSSHRPQHVNVKYYENLDDGKAYLGLQSRNPISEVLAGEDTWHQGATNLLPFSARQSSFWRDTTTSALPGPELEVLSRSTTANGYKVSLNVSSPRHADNLVVAVPKGQQLVSYQLADQEYKVRASENQQTVSIYFSGVYGKNVELDLVFKTSEAKSVWLADISTELPPQGADIASLRGELATPVHRGDEAILFHRITLKPE